MADNGRGRKRKKLDEKNAKDRKHLKDDALANWAKGNGERVEEDDGVLVVSRDKDGNLVENYDTEVKRRPASPIRTAPHEETPKQPTMEKVNKNKVNIIEIGRAHV